MKYNKDGVPTLRPASADDIKGLVLLDVRRPDEYVGELGHIAGAELKTLGPELAEHLETMDKTKPVLMICRSGARSANATMYALQLGFKEVYNMEGGMILWNELGLPVTR